MQDVEASIRVTNITCFDEDVKLFYTSPDGKYSLSTSTDNYVVKRVVTTPSMWGPLLNVDGSIWVSDGKTFPFAFGSTRFFIVKFIFGLDLYSKTTFYTAKESIEGFFRRVNEDIAQLLLAGVASFTTIEEARTLGLLGIGGLEDTGEGSTPIGVEMIYNGNNLSIELVTACPASSSNSYQSVTIPGEGTFSFTGGTGVKNLFLNRNSLGWVIGIIIKDLQGDDYNSLLNSLLNNPLYIDELRQYSRSASQVIEPLNFIQYDVDGNIRSLVETNVVDPYQAQPSLDSYADILLSGQTYCVVKILAGESLELRIVVEEGGALTYEDLKSIDDLLAEQGVDMIYQSEREELKETWSNFDGFKENKENENKYKLLLIALLAILIIK
tara:strand:- start:137 stop:1285 length:1149 start_codon:yes stop_codon:yes gene_type:complete